jgi:NAD(P)-dependent dehydrogenase (short-subunit alcohol dehydrogenase family)/acyl dehydratase
LDKRNDRGDGLIGELKIMDKTVQFDEKTIEVFRKISHDNNPLHVDKKYARKTSFGQNVVYGMASVVSGLGLWAQGRCFSLLKIRGRFAKPLFVNGEYTAKIDEQGNLVRITISQNGVVRTQFSFSWVPFDGNDNGGFTSGFKPLKIANSKKPKEWEPALGSFPYCIDESISSEFSDRFGLDSSQLPQHQLFSLLWSSYYIGMEIPGEQALFTGFQFDYDNGDVLRHEFLLENVECAYDDLYNKMTLKGKGTGIRSFVLEAFNRPAAVQYSLSTIKNVIGESEMYKDKVVLITGSSRGFGAVIAKAFALHGATIVLNNRTDAEEIANVAREISAVHSRIFTVQGDVGCWSDCQKMKREIAEKVSMIDILINNASPNIHSYSFYEQSPEAFSEFVGKSFDMTFFPCRAFLPSMSENGLVITLSTIYAKTIEKYYTHYIAAKYAVEGLTKAMAMEFHNKKFLIVRPPRMLTDQTNVVFDMHKPVSAATVAQRLFDVIKGLPAQGNLFEADL